MVCNDANVTIIDQNLCAALAIGIVLGNTMAPR